MYKVLDNDGLFDQDKAYEYEFKTLKECYDFLIKQFSYLVASIRLVETGLNTWKIQYMFKHSSGTWYDSLFWTVEKVEDNG